MRVCYLTAAVVMLSLRLVMAGPDIAATVPADGAVVSALTSLRVTFSEPVTGVNATDLGVNGNPAAGVTGSGAGPYVFTFPQPPAGTVSFSWDVDQSIAGLGTGEFVPAGSITVTLTDNLPPQLAKLATSVPGQEMDDVQPSPGSAAGMIRQAVVNFSEEVSGVDAADLLVNGVAAAVVTGSAAGPYVFQFEAVAEGVVQFSWAASHGIADAAGNLFAGTGWSAVRAASAGQVVISEFLAANAGTRVMAGADPDGVRDENWDLSPWVELYNAGTGSVSLRGWSLTDSTDEPRQWVLPDRTLAGGERLLVWVSGKDRKPAAGHLHANFGLKASGGSLALYAPDCPAAAPVSAWLNYPEQRYDYSYGLSEPGGEVRYFSPPTATQGLYTLPSSDIGSPPGTVPPVPLGRANGASSLAGVMPEPEVSVPRGFYDGPFRLVLSCREPGAVIRYTLDGSVPVATSAGYTGPLEIAATTVLRMVAFGEGKVPSRTVTHTYLFASSVVDQPSPPYDHPAVSTDNGNPQPPAPGGTKLPVAWGTNATFTAAQTLPGANNLTAGQIPADYGMDPKVHADPQRYDDSGRVSAEGVTNRERIERCLRTLPALSLVMKGADMFGAYPNGTVPAGTVDPLYPNSAASIKRDMTKPCSLEMMQADGTTVFVIEAGIDLHGNASRDPFKNPKHGFVIRFRGRYGAGKLEAPLFPDSPVREWDKLILRGDFGGSWLHQNGVDALTVSADTSQRPRGIRIREAFSKESFRDMGGAASHHRFCNLFINGVCWGSYELMEDEAEDFGASYFGGEKDDFDVVDQGKLKSGNWQQWSAMKSLLGWTGGTANSDRPTPPSVAVFQSAFTNAQYEQLRTFLDLPWFQDYMIWHHFAGHRDWATGASDAAPYMKNVYFLRPRKGTFRTMPWDMENLLWHQDEDRVTGMTSFGSGAPSLLPPAAIHPRAVMNPEYRLEFADRVWRHLIRPGGALTPSANLARLDKWMAVVGPDAICLESARWGDYRYKVHPYTTGTVNQVYTWNGSWFEGGVPRYNTGRTAATLGTWNQGMANAWWDEIRRLRTAYFPVRTANVVNQFRTNGLYPLLGAPELRDERTGNLLADGVVAAGTQVALVNPADASGAFATEIWYTLDGTDPRPPYDQTGAPRGSAQRYEKPITVDAGVIIRARRAVRVDAAGGDAAQAKAPVRVASPSLQVTVTYNAVGGASGRGQITAAPRTVDGVALVEGDRVLLKNQSVGSQNGIWVVTVPGSGSNGQWDRAADWDQDGEVRSGTWVRVISGNQNQGTVWRVTNTAAVTVGGSTGTSVGFAVFTPWSALMEHRLTVGAPLPSVAISEIHYNPPANQGGSASEFLEFVNHGRLPVDMGGWWMSGVEFVFPAGFVLAPGQRVVIVSNDNPVIFASQYPGVEPLGYFGGNLSNGGERLTLFDAAGRVVYAVEYDDDLPWPVAADNRGSSLEMVDPAGDSQASGNWKASPVRGGTPGSGGTLGLFALRIGEFHAASGQGVFQGQPMRDFVEVINAGGVPIELAGWTVNGVALGAAVLAPGARLVVDVPLERSQGEVVLALGAVTMESVRYGPQTAGLSFYRDAESWRVGEPSPGGVSTALPLAFPPAALRFSEVLADPVPGEDDWLELRNEGALPVVLTGLTFGAGEAAMRVVVPAVIGAGEYVTLRCAAGSRRGDALNLNLPAAGGSLWWRDAAWQLGDSIVHGRQEEGVTSGRLGGQGAWVRLDYPSPGLPNEALPPVRPRFSEVLVINRNGDNTPWATRDAWVELVNPAGQAADLGGWRIRSVVVTGGSVDYALPEGTVLGAGGFLPIWSRTLGMPFDAEVYNHHGLELIRPDGQIMDRVTWGRQLPDQSIGRQADGSWALLERPTRGTPNAGGRAMGSPGGLRLNEWQGAAGGAGPRGEFIEVFNPHADPVDVGGLWLGDAPGEAGRFRHRLPALSLVGPRGHLLLRPAGQPSTEFPGGMPAWPVTYGFGLSPAGHTLTLSLADGGRALIDAVSFGPPPVMPQSGGRVSDGAATIGELVASPGWPNGGGPAPYFHAQPEDVVVALGEPWRLRASVALADSAFWTRNGQVLPDAVPAGAKELVLERSAAAMTDDGIHVVSAVNAAGTTVSRAARVTVLYNYSRWASAFGVGAAGSDDDRDGIANGMEFLAGSDPNVPESAAGQAALQVIPGIMGAEFTMEFVKNRRASYTMLSGERSSRLSGWVPADAVGMDVIAADPEGRDRLRLRFAMPAGEESSFWRLRLVP